MSHVAMPFFIYACEGMSQVLKTENFAVLPPS